jgi:hypothetical protein
MTDAVGVRTIDAGAGSVPDPAFEPGRPLAPELLYTRCEAAALPFDLCTELEAETGLIGQERAVEALEFALRMRAKGYNAYALGAGGTGRHSMVEDLLRRRAESEPTPPDWCYVNKLRRSAETASAAIAARARRRARSSDEGAGDGITFRPAGRL